MTDCEALETAISIHVDYLVVCGSRMASQKSLPKRALNVLSKDET